MTHLLRALVCCLVLVSGCSTLKGWFTPQGQKLTQAQTLADQKQPLGASAAAAEALALEPGYEEAQALLAKTFVPGQEQFKTEETHWLQTSDPLKWDRLYQLYRWQEALARQEKLLGPAYRVPTVADKLALAARGASQYHWQLAQTLLNTVPGPRQARKALVEGQKASEFDPTTPGLAGWLTMASEASLQKLMVLPFFPESLASLRPVSGPLANQISQLLIPTVPGGTTVFPSDGLVTLPGSASARLGLVSQPEAFQLARSAGQNLVLMGQITKVAVQEPKTVTQVVVREKIQVLVDPANPKGMEKVLKATVTRRIRTATVTLAASYSLLEVDTGSVLFASSKEAKLSATRTEASFTGDRGALTVEDWKTLEESSILENADDLWTEAIEQVASGIADAVRTALK